MSVDGTGDLSTRDFASSSPPRPPVATSPPVEPVEVDGSPNAAAVTFDAPDRQHLTQGGSANDDGEADDTFSVMSPPRERRHTFSRTRHGYASSDNATIRDGSITNETASLRNRGRSNTVRSFIPPTRPHCEPGAEPGIDPEERSLEDLTGPHVPCAIVVLDYSETKYERHDFDRDSFGEFINQPRPDWVTCRWICVDGLNTSIVKLLGRKNKLHPLAIEDTLKARSRPKVDWYSDHCYVCLTMQRLVTAPTQQLVESNPDFEEIGRTFGPYPQHSRRQPTILQRNFTQRPSVAVAKAMGDFSYNNEHSPSEPVIHNAKRPIRTFQRWRGGTDYERIEYMEATSALTKRGHSTHIEQVSIFITADNSVISFFEGSASEIIGGEEGVGGLDARIARDNGVLRRCPDASMLLHALLDVIVDLSIPIAEAYDHALGNLQLEILTDPDIEQPNDLFTLISEVDLFEAAIQPVVGLIDSLQGYDPKPIETPGQANRQMTDPFRMSSIVVITPLTRYYLNDVKDHVIMLNAQLERMHRNTEQLTSLIFNILSAHQSDSMKQLTLVTIFFLPLTFLVGYFGQNFDKFSAVRRSDAFFWYIAIPTMFITCLFLTRGRIMRGVDSVVTKWGIRKSVKRRRLFESRRVAQQQQRQREQSEMEHRRTGSVPVEKQVIDGEPRTSEGASKFV